jgi:uncharacterized protein YjiS (DUF1127 family)
MSSSVSAKESIMSNLVQKLRTALAQRRAYRRAVAEIAAMDERELADLRVDPGTLIAGVFQEVYGSGR